MGYQTESKYKAIIKVRADHDFYGSVRPLMFREEDGPRVVIDRVLDVRQAASLRAGGQGMRYTCRVEGREMFLFDEDGVWFIERPRLPGDDFYMEEFQDDCSTC